MMDDDISTLCAGLWVAHAKGKGGKRMKEWWCKAVKAELSQAKACCATRRQEGKRNEESRRRKNIRKETFAYR
jgi:hypothetical protein